MGSRTICPAAASRMSSSLDVRDDGDFAGTAVTDEMLRQLAEMKVDGNTLPPPSTIMERRTLVGNDQTIFVPRTQPYSIPSVRNSG